MILKRKYFLVIQISAQSFNPFSKKLLANVGHQQALTTTRRELITATRKPLARVNTALLKRSRSLTSLIRNESSSSQKSLNWLIQPHREKCEPSSSTIEMGGRVNQIENDENNMLDRPTRNGTYYHEKIILGYSAEEMCDLVGNVAKYKEFLPFCLNSEIISDENK